MYDGGIPDSKVLVSSGRHFVREGMPIQPAGARGIRGTVEVLPKYEKGLQDLEGFSHIYLLYWFHLSEGTTLQ